jgi:dienelactone hydrolase
VTCAHETTMLATIASTPDRAVHYQVPLGAPPAAGFPVVVAFQGTSLPSELTWSGHATDAYGLYYQALVVARLLDAGYAVITPDVAGGGTTYWDTNVPPYATAWESSPDHQLMLHLFAAIEAGDFGPLDESALYAMGFSSGGYMTSRMAVSYPGRFRALAIASGSYATCGGVLCVVPSTLPADHPPTLFLHGMLDTLVPIATMMQYEAQLHDQGVATRVVTEAAAGHQWIAAAPDEVPSWFSSR